MLRSQRLVAYLAAQDTAALLEAFDAGAADVAHRIVGVAATLDALARGQVATVLFDPSRIVCEAASDAYASAN